MKSSAVWSVIVGLTLIALLILPSAATEPDTGQQFIVVPPHAGLESFPGEWKITGAQSGGAYGLVEIRVTVLPKGPRPVHIHTREDEAWYVIDGELTFQVGDQVATAGPGTFVFARRNVPHTYRATRVPTRYLLMFSPAGLERLFAEVADLRKKYTGPSGEFVPTPEFEKEFKELGVTFRKKYGTSDATLPPAKGP